jgi:hypothetical protein
METPSATLDEPPQLIRKVHNKAELSSDEAYKELCRIAEIEQHHLREIRLGSLVITSQVFFLLNQKIAEERGTKDNWMGWAVGRITVRENGSRSYQTSES